MLLLIEGFTHIIGAYARDELRRKFNPYATYGGEVGAQMVVTANAGRRTGSGASGPLFYGQTYLQPHLEHLTSTNTLILGYAFKLAGYPTAYPSDGSNFLVLGRFTEKPGSSELHHVDVRLEQDHTITINRGIDGARVELHRTAVQTFVYNEWHYIEIKCVVDGSAGAVIVKKDEVTIASISGQDTDNGGTTKIIGQVSFGLAGGGSMGIYNVTDMYIADDTGSVNNDFLGDVRVDTLFVTGNGATNDFTPSAGSNYQNVDDASFPDGNSTYNDGASVGDREEYEFGNISHNPATVFGVQVVHTTIRRDGAAREVQAQINGASVGPVVPLRDVYVPFTAISETGWDQTAINAMKAGIEITT